MKALATVAIVSQLGGCTFAVNHPPAAAAITGAVVALSACELDGPKQSTCAIVGGSVAAALGLIAAVAMWLAPEDTSPQTIDPILMIPDNDRPVHVPTKTLPPPKPLQDLPPAPPPTDPTAPPATPATPAPTTPASPTPPTTAPPTPPNPTSSPAPGASTSPTSPP